MKVIHTIPSVFVKRISSQSADDFSSPEERISEYWESEWRLFVDKSGRIDFSIANRERPNAKVLCTFEPCELERMHDRHRFLHGLVQAHRRRDVSFDAQLLAAAF